jgi:hypothetical protein
VDDPPRQARPLQLARFHLPNLHGILFFRALDQGQLRRAEISFGSGRQLAEATKERPGAAQPFANPSSFAGLMRGVSSAKGYVP